MNLVELWTVLGVTGISDRESVFDDMYLHPTLSMNTKLLRLAASGIVAIGTAISMNAINAIAPVELLSLNNFGQIHSNRALAQDADEQVSIRVYQQASPAVVSIGAGEGTGSGSIISADGLVLTNAHVVRDARTVSVTLADGRRFEADVIGFGESGLDLAALKIRGQNNLPTIRIASPGSVQVGQRAFAIGNPFGRFQGTYTNGIVSRIDQERGLLQTDAAINPGNSGGPLLNSRGELIGVNSSIFTTGRTGGNIGIGFAISMERVQPFLTAVREGRAPRTAQSPTPFADRPAQRVAIDGRPLTGNLGEGSNVLPVDNSYFNLYTFDGRSGQQVIIEMTSSEVDTYLILLKPDGSELAQDDDGAGGTNSRIAVTLPDNGTYTLLANSYAEGEAGAYNLRLAETGSVRRAQAGNASPRPQSNTPSPRPQGGMILQEQGVLDSTASVLESDGSLYREYTFQGTVGQRVTITMESSDFDTYLILVGPDGEAIEQNDDISESDLNSQIITTLPGAGEYRVIANAFDDQGRGRFTLTIR